MKAFSYNENFEFIGEVECQYDELDKQYLLPAKATFIKLIKYNEDLEYLQFNIDKQKWIKQDITINEKYFLKTNGELYETILKKNILLYTKKEIILNAGDEVCFDDSINDWIYNIKGEETLLKELQTAKTNKNTLIQDAYSLAQFALVNNNNSTFKIELKGNNWLDFERQVLKANINGVADFIAINEDGVLKIIKDILFTILQPLYKALCDVSVGNYIIKNQLLYQVNNAEDILTLENIIITFPEIQTFTI